MAIGSTGNAELRMHQNRFFQTWMFKIYFQCPLNIEKAYCFLLNKKHFIYRNYWVWLCSYFNQIISYTFACGLIICSYCKNLCNENQISDVVQNNLDFSIVFSHIMDVLLRRTDNNFLINFCSCYFYLLHLLLLYSCLIII